MNTTLTHSPRRSSQLVDSVEQQDELVDAIRQIVMTRRECCLDSLVRGVRTFYMESGVSRSRSYEPQWRASAHTDRMREIQRESSTAVNDISEDIRGWGWRLFCILLGTTPV